MRIGLLLLGCLLSIPVFASGEKGVPLGDVAERAVQQSKLTLPGSRPFHLKAEILETTNPSSEYQAKIEEYWVSPTKWYRTIETPEFSQTLIVNGDQVSEKDKGNYFPWWLNDLLQAMMDPLPMLDMLKRTGAQMKKPQGGPNSTTCCDLHTKIDRWVFCFEGSRGLMTSAFARGYSAELKDFADFGDKRVARLILTDPEPGTTIQARITHLSELRQVDEALFSVAQITPPQEQLKTVRVDEDLLRQLSLTDTKVIWPPVGGGPLKGRCAVYVSADRTGRIREVWPKGCDNPGLQDPLREMVGKWELKPAAENGIPVQVEALVTFPFETELVTGSFSPKVSSEALQPPTADPSKSQHQMKGPPVVSPEVIDLAKPNCSAGESCHGIHGEVVVIVDVLANGQVGDVSIRSGDPRLFDDAKKAAKKCTFRPGNLLGVPTSMNFELKYQF